MKFDPKLPPQGTIRDWIDHHSRQKGDSPAFIFTDSDETLTWRDIHNEAKRIAACITSCGVTKGESVAVMMPNGREGVIAFFGTVYGGFRAAMINLAAGDDAIAFALEHSQARVAFVGEDQNKQFLRASKDIVTLDISGQNISGQTKENLFNIAPRDHSILMYTSGTTGIPKGVVHSHSSLLAGGWTTALAHQLTTEDRGLCVLPIYHINGLCVTVMSTLLTGGSLAIAPKFSASNFWELVRKHEVTWFSVVPTIISYLLHNPMDLDNETKKRVRFGRSASSALAPDMQHGFEKRFNVPIIETMGLTETAAQILSNPLPPKPRKMGSPGIAFGNVVTIIDSNFNDLPAGKRGEIAVSGPNIMQEYFNDPDATREAFAPNNKLRTGDFGYMDEDGYFYVTGRLKELIIKGGENIAPREIDEALYSHSNVIEAAAFSKPCDTYGETVLAAVKIAENSDITEQSLIALCNQKLGKFKTPERIFILEELPKGPSGKIQRAKIAEMVR